MSEAASHNVYRALLSQQHIKLCPFVRGSPGTFSTDDKEVAYVIVTVKCIFKMGLV